MPNRCVAAACGNMPSVVIVSHFSVFRKNHIYAICGPDKFSERGRIGNLLPRRFFHLQTQRTCAGKEGTKVDSGRKTCSEKGKFLSASDCHGLSHTQS